MNKLCKMFNAGVIGLSAIIAGCEKEKRIEEILMNPQVLEKISQTTNQDTEADPIVKNIERLTPQDSDCFNYKTKKGTLRIYHNGLDCATLGSIKGWTCLSNNGKDSYFILFQTEQGVKELHVEANEYAEKKFMQLIVANGTEIKVYNLESYLIKNESLARDTYNVSLNNITVDKCFFVDDKGQLRRKK